MKRFPLLAAFAAIFLSYPAFACLGPFANTTTLFETLPALGIGRPLVAKVSILPSLNTAQEEEVRAKVIDAIKGTELGATLRFATLASSCESNPPIAPGKNFYVAGAINKEGLFEGAWKAPLLEFSERCARAKCRGKEDCGCDWLKRGGELVAQCEDHAWSYLVKVSKSTKLCRGINARGGPEEDSCEDFTGTVAGFARCEDKQPKDLNAR